MKRILAGLALWAIGAVLIGTAIAQENPANRMLSQAEALADIDLLQQAYERVHPGYTRYASAEDLAAAWRTVRASAADGISVGDLYLEVQRALTVIACDHTKAELPKALREDRNRTPVYLPFKWTFVDGRGFITSAPEGSPFRPLDEIIALDGRALGEIVAERAPLIPVDGYAVWARRGGIAQSLEFAGGAVDHFGALMERVPANAVVKVRRLTQGSDETIIEASVDRLVYDAYRAITEPDEPAGNFKDAVTFKRLGESAAYLRVDSFVNYRQPVDPGEIYDPIFDALKKEKRETLILDLRRNGGGSDDASGGLARRLIAQKHRFIKEIRMATIDHSGLEPYISTWEKKVINPPRFAFRKNTDGSYSVRRFFDDALKISKPEENAFTGRLIILTSNNNSSGSTNLIAALKTLGRATLVGEATGGSPNGATAGVIFTFTAPNSGVKARIPVLRYVNNVSGFKDGYGIEPDIAAPMTAKAFLDGKDPAYEAALEMIDLN